VHLNRQKTHLKVLIGSDTRPWRKYFFQTSIGFDAIGSGLIMPLSNILTHLTDARLMVGTQILKAEEVIGESGDHAMNDHKATRQQFQKASCNLKVDGMSGCR
jgi:hypothetical protein